MITSDNDRIDAQVAREKEDNPFNTGRRGVNEIWRRIERDIEEQQSFYSAER